MAAPQCRLCGERHYGFCRNPNSAKPKSDLTPILKAKPVLEPSGIPCPKCGAQGGIHAPMHARGQTD